ncbi:transposase [Streptomyces sp. 2333.5]|nr:transposase [Streptomyces sp. 2333.5]SEE96728.1 Transposase [Streptomyces sp. 2314.4]SEF10907.1 Transposase [Streptomyces sp. 2112.2]
MHHRNAPLSVEGRRRLVERCENRPIAHVAAEMGISRACASKWVNRYRRCGDLGLHDRSSAPHRQPTAIGADVVARIEELRRTRKWSAARIAFELVGQGTPIGRRTVSRLPTVRMVRPAPAACRSVLVVAEAGEKVVLVVQVVLDVVRIRPRSTRQQAAPG